MTQILAYTQGKEGPIGTIKLNTDVAVFSLPEQDAHVIAFSEEKGQFFLNIFLVDIGSTKTTYQLDPQDNLAILFTTPEAIPVKIESPYEIGSKVETMLLTNSPQVLLESLTQI